MIKNIIQKIRLFSNKGKESYLLFYKLLGFCPADIGYYQLAIRHKSVPIRTEDNRLLSNERLEFLGDAVLNSVVSDILYHRYEDKQEGFLTGIRSRIVSRDSLNHIAIKLGLDKMVVASRHVNLHATNDIYGNALEAVVGAVYLDQGYDICKAFVEDRLLLHFVDWDVVVENEVNYKSKLLEWCHRNHIEPEFVLLEEQVTKNKHTFRTSLVICHKVICEATGSNKKESQQKASEIAYHKIISNENFLQELLQEVSPLLVEVINQ